MKRTFLLITAFLLLAGGRAAAQDWKEALKKAATEAADKATDGKLTQYALVGTWNYTSPGVKFEGNDLLSQLGGSALEGTVKNQLGKIYQTVGINPGAGSVTFGKDGAFSTQMGGYKLSGTYEFDASTHVAALLFAKEKIGKEKIDLGSVPAHAYLNGTELILVFPVSKLIDIIKTYGSKVSSMETIVALLEQYKNVYIGFEFSREPGQSAK
ncbi:DUF4923 family protein [uncultured Alistipes sp.]|uniref:DUF4923 family protein n=1 Tax=Alistipes sp. TaxID=1872444 RepID=UPI002623C706|nr:DUF4923 family protein [uncultured Alistipes sp.]